MAGGERNHRAGVFQLCRRLLRYAVKRWKGLLSILAITILKTGMDVLRPWPMKLLVDNVLSQKPLQNTVSRVIEFLPGASSRQGLLEWCIAATVILFLLGWAFGLASSYANISFGQRMIYDLAEDLYAHLQRLSLRFHSRKSVGDLIRRVTVDSGCVSTIVNDALLPVAASAFTLLSMFIIMLRMDVALTLLSLAVIPCMILTVRRYSAPMEHLSYKQQEAEGEIYTVVERTLSAMPVVQAFGGEERADRQLEASLSETLRATIAQTKSQFHFKILTGAATAAGTAAILWVGGLHVLDGRLTVGSILVFISYLGALYGPLESLMYTASTIYSAAGSGRRVMEVLDSEPEVRDHPEAQVLTEVRGHIKLEDVTFGYEQERPILKGITLEALPGETIAIVGPTGAGKSTLVSLIPRFFDPWEGRVTIDGEDLREIDLKSLRNQVGIVLQEPFLFPLTIAENISYGRPDATREEIEDAARAANAHQFIERLPEGYETVIGERGATLSGGERQRLSIARALLKDAPVLILDEPTSSLDAQTEAMLLEALERLMKGRTTFIIAHRLSTIRKADRIVVIEDGEVAEQGTHRELIARNGLYSFLYKIQFGQAKAVGEVA